VPTESPKTEGSPLFGCVFLLIVAAAIGTFVYSKYFGKSQPVVVSLSAYFVDDSGNPLISADDSNGHLKIKGQVYLTGKPLEQGNVRLTVSKEDDSFQQAVSLDLKGGMFESDDAAFRPLGREDKLHVRAEVSSTTLPEPASAEVYLNTATPSLSRTWAFVVWIGIVVVLVIITIGFFVTFTGKRTPEKNRNAIVFSYLFGGVFLAVPLLAPVLLLQVFPNLRQAMIGAPAGLVLTRVGTPPEDKVQWALNIGGYSKLATAASPTPTPIGKANPTSTATPVRTAAASPTPQPSQTPTTTPVPGSSPQPTQNVVSAASPRSSPQPTPSVSTQEISKQEVSKEDVSEGVVNVEGGLVIPLYVIMLSVIGGAINMIRKVPQFQGEGEYFEPASRGSLGLWPTLKMAGTSIKGLFTGSTKPDKPAEPTVNLVTTDEVQKDQDEIPPAELAPTDTPPVTVTTKAVDGTAVPPAGAGGGQPVPTQASQQDEPSLDDRAKLVDAQLDKLVKDQLNRRSRTRTISSQINDKVQEMQRLFDSKSDDQRLLEFESFETWMGSRVGLKEVLGRNWRVELLNQYMYLISAPFLAIVAYFMLDLLSLTKKPILVLISFSVGLISERILTWILGLASGYLRGNSKTQSAPS